MEVICLEEPAFFALVERVVDRLGGTKNVTEDKWISGAEAMHKLRITSKTTLQKLRDEGKIRYSQPTTKILLYDAESINSYLEDNTYETF